MFSSTSNENHSAVPREGDLWLNLAEMKDVNKARFLNAPISQAGLYGDTVRTLPSSSQRYSSRPRRSSTSCPGVMHHPPLPPGLPVAVGALLRPPELLRPRLNWHLSRREAVPPRPTQAPNRPGSRRSGPDAGNPEMLEFALSQENNAAPSPGGGPGGESSVSVCFCWASGTHLLKEIAISFSSGFSGPWDDSVWRPASSLSPTTHFASSQQSTVWGRFSSPRTSGQSRLGPREFGEDASECTTFCTIHPYSLSLHHHEVRRLCRWSRLHSVWRRGSRCPACLAGSCAQFDSATWFSSPGDLPSSTAFSRRRWQSGTPLSCARRLLSSWQRMQSSRSLQLRWGRGFTALTSSYPRKVVAFGQSWICESWTGLYTSSRSRCWRTGAWSNAFSPRIGLQLHYTLAVQIKLQLLHSQ